MDIFWLIMQIIGCIVFIPIAIAMIAIFYALVFGCISIAIVDRIKGDKVTDNKQR